MPKIMALDIGDVWTGIALCDALHILAKPLTTVKAYDIERELVLILKKESIEAIVVGYPKTLKGTESDQTKKVVAVYEELQKKFPTVRWVLWDERLSSKRAADIKKGEGKADKLKSHAIAAAFILDSYLNYLNSQKSL